MQRQETRDLGPMEPPDELTAPLVAPPEAVVVPLEVGGQTAKPLREQRVKRVGSSPAPPPRDRHLAWENRPSPRDGRLAREHRPWASRFSNTRAANLGARSHIEAASARRRPRLRGGRLGPR